MIRFVRHKAINFEKWDATIQNASNGNIYAYSWYLNHLGTWDALIQGDYDLVLPLIYNRKWFGFRQIYQPYFCQQLGLFGRDKIAPATMDAFLGAIPKNYFKIYFQCNEGNPQPSLKRFSYHSKTNYVLNLNHPIAHLKAHFAKSLRRNIKIGTEHISIKKEALSIQQILKDYQGFLGKNGHNINWKKAQSLLESCHKKGHLFSYTAFAENGHPIASTLFLKSHQRLTYLIGVSSSQGKKAKAIPALLYHVIALYAEQPYLLDFEGSSIESIAYFFGSFGAEPREYWGVESL